MRHETVNSAPPVQPRRKPPAVVIRQAIRYAPIFILLVFFAFLLLAPDRKSVV